jgi:hypothetical protein
MPHKLRELTAKQNKHCMEKIMNNDFIILPLCERDIKLDQYVSHLLAAPLIALGALRVLYAQTFRRNNKIEISKAVISIKYTVRHCQIIAILFW